MGTIQIKKVEKTVVTGKQGDIYFYISMLVSEMEDKNSMTKAEMKKLIKELTWYVGMLRRDINECYMQDALDDLTDIQGISAQLQEAVEQRLGK